MAIKTDESVTTLISVLGIARCDIVYYIARLLNAADKTVLIVDNTLDNGLFHSIRKPEGEDMAQIGNIAVISNKKYSEYFFSQYDYVLIYHGMNMNQELCEASDFRIMVSDYHPYQTARIRSKMRKLSKNLDYYVVCRDKVSSKVSDKDILQELGIKSSNVIETYEISYNDTDYMCYLNLLRNGTQQPKSTSSEMRDFLKNILYHFLSDIPQKEVQKIYKNGLSGKIR